MSEELKELFEKRNKEILNNKIKLDIDNNTDSLRLTINNVIMLEMNKLNKNIIKFCEENNILFDVNDINKLIEEEKKKLEDIVNTKLEERKDSFDKYVSSEENEDIDYLKKCTDIMLDNIKTNILKENAICFLPNITNKFNLKNEEDLIRLNGLVRLSFNTICVRIENNTMTRFINLCNIIKESRHISEEYSKKTVDAVEKNSSKDAGKSLNKASKKMKKKSV